MILLGCGGAGDEKPAGLSNGAHLAARLPTDDALNIAVVDVNAVRRGLGMGARAAPPTGSRGHDQAFIGETGPALGILQGGVVPAPIVDNLLTQARSVASVTGDRAATAISTRDDPARLESLLRSSGLKEEDESVFVPEDGTYAIAIGARVIAIAESPGDARSILEETDGEVPQALKQIDGDGDLVTVARFGARCIDSIGTSDTVRKAGEVSFFTSTTPDPSRVVSSDEPAAAPHVVGDSARVEVPAAKHPSGEPPALKALESVAVDYDCDG